MSFQIFSDNHTHNNDASNSHKQVPPPRKPLGVIAQNRTLQGADNRHHPLGKKKADGGGTVKSYSHVGLKPVQAAVVQHRPHDVGVAAASATAAAAGLAPQSHAALQKRKPFSVFNDPKVLHNPYQDDPYQFHSASHAQELDENVPPAVATARVASSNNPLLPAHSSIAQNQSQNRVAAAASSTSTATSGYVCDDTFSDLLGSPMILDESSPDTYSVEMRSNHRSSPAPTQTTAAASTARASTASSIAAATSLSLSAAANAERVKRERDLINAEIEEYHRIITECPDYLPEIYENLRLAERRYRPKENYMRKQTDISYAMRSILVDWLIEVAEEYKMHRETVYLSVNYLDRFLSHMSVIRTKLQLVGTSAIFVASKFEEIYPPETTEFVYITDDTYTKSQVLRMESLMLRTLKFDISPPTINQFLTIFLNEITPKNEIRDNLAFYLSELTLVDGEIYLKYRPSEVAVSAVYIAHQTVCAAAVAAAGADGRPMTGTEAYELDEMMAPFVDVLADKYGYPMSEFRKCLSDLHVTFQEANSRPQKAVYDKYSSDKLNRVSLIPPPPLLLPHSQGGDAPSSAAAHTSSHPTAPLHRQHSRRPLQSINNNISNNNNQGVRRSKSRSQSPLSFHDK